MAGFLGTLHDPEWFVAEQVPSKIPVSVSEQGIVMAWLVGNLYLLLAFIGIAVLSTTAEIKVVRAYLIALWLGDIGHVGFSCYGLGRERALSPGEWNAMAWGNIGATVSLVHS